MESERTAMLRKRAEIIRHIRGFFHQSAYLEVDTPLLAPFLIPESPIEVFKTEYFPIHKEPVELYLIPSPELWMKRLLAAGTGNIFQICRSFRNHEHLSPLHQPEFTLLEWYTVQAGYKESIPTLEELFSHLLQELKMPPLLQFKDLQIDLSPPFRRLSMQEAFMLYAGSNLEEVTALKAIRRTAGRLSIPLTPRDSWEDIFQKIFLTRVEPYLPSQEALILYDYPSAIPTLAKNKEHTPWAERWELYLGGVEVANCYTEETNPRKIEAFIRKETAKKKKALIPHRFDTEFPRLFTEEFPDCSGVALGVDRLLLFFLNQESLQGVNFFPPSDIKRS